MPLVHATEDALELYALKLLNATQVAEVEEHLLVCESCRTHLVGLEEELSLLLRALNHWEVEERRKAAQAKKQNGPFLIFRERKEK